MKPSPVLPVAMPSPSARVEFTVRFSNGPEGRREIRSGGEGATGPGTSPIPSVAHQDKPTPVPPHAIHAPAPPTPEAPTAERVPKITQFLVLGHLFERLVRNGVIRDYAEIARRTGLTRARMTQIVNLTLLAPDIQEEILSAAADHERLVERRLRPLGELADWKRQRESWRPILDHVDRGLADRPSLRRGSRRSMRSDSDSDTTRPSGELHG